MQIVIAVLFGLGFGGFIIATPALALGAMQEERKWLRYTMYIVPGMVSIILICVAFALQSAG